MTFKWFFITLLQYELLKLTEQSIAGVTYMDHFDFEERYRDVNECNPFHWHPLHMPEHCADMYEKLIRSRIANQTPVRIVRTKEKILGSSSGESNRGERSEEDEYHSSVYGFHTSVYGYNYPIYEAGSHEAYKRPPLSPYEEMLELVKKDVKKDPSAPSVQFLPGLGPVAIYHQPVSGKTEMMIKKIATAYAKAGQKSYVDYAPYVPFGTPANQPLGSIKNKLKINKKKGRVITKNLDNGVITIMRSKSNKPNNILPEDSMR